MFPLAQADDRWAPNAVAGPVNQLEVAGNACGPASLLTAYRCGSERYQKVASEIPGSSDKSKLLYIIRAHGLQPSNSLNGRKRWTKTGINSKDLEEIAGELAGIAALHGPRSDSLVRGRRESPEKLVKRLHSRLRNSLKQGFPPVLNLRRHALVDGQWQSIQGHFVTVVRVPDRLPRGAKSFSFTYFEPWGGKKVEGHFHIPSEPVLSPSLDATPCLVAKVPAANIGKTKVRNGARSEVVPSVIIGRW